MMASQTSIFRLPKLAESYKIFADNSVNPNHDRVRFDSRAWINKFNKTVYGPQMRAFMDNCNFELCSSYTFPYADEAGLRATMDVTNIYFLYDEFTDIATGDEATKAAVTVSRALHEPDFDDGTWICHMMKEFRQNHIDKAGPNNARRFIENFCTYADLVGTEAVLREKNEVLDIPSYISFRRETSAMRNCFDLVEYCLGLDFPQSVYDDPVFTIGYNAAMDLVFWTNDVVSYNMEQSKGHGGANIVTVIMKSQGIDLQAALDFVGGYCEALKFQFQEARRMISLRDDSKDLVRMMDAFGDWVRGYEEWSLTTERYFGKNTKTVKKTGLFELKTPFSDVIMLYN